MPQLENVMQNYTSCNNMMIGPARRFAIIFAVGEKAFSIFRRKYNHNFRVQIDKNNLEAQKAVEIASSNLIFVSNTSEILIFSNLTLSPCGTIPIPLLDSETREPN
jgi:hypothetical protein